MRTSWSDPEAFGRHHRRGHAKMRRFTAWSQQRSLGMVRTIRWMTQYDTLSMRDYEIYMKYKPLLNLYWTFRIFSAWLPQSMGSPVLPRDSCDSVLPCFTAWKRSIDWKDRKAVSCKLKAVCDHKQVRNASSPPLAGLVFPGTIELCWSTHVFQCRTSHCKVSTSSFQSFSHTFWWARQWTGTEIGTTDDPSIALDIRFASDTWWKWSTLLACGRSKLSMLDSFTIL